MASEQRDTSRRRPTHPPRRHGCVLCVRRAAGQSRAARPASGRWRRPRQARRRRSGQLRGAHVRRPVGNSDVARSPALPVAGHRASGLSEVPRGLAAGIRHLSQRDAAGRAAVARRGVSRRHRERLGRGAGHERRAEAEERDSRGDRAHGICRCGAKQVPREDRVWLAEAGWADRDGAGASRAFPAGASGRCAMGSRPGHRAQAALARHRQADRRACGRSRRAACDRRFAGGVAETARAGHRRSPGGRRLRAEVVGQREHVRHAISRTSPKSAKRSKAWRAAPRDGSPSATSTPGR